MLCLLRPTSRLLKVVKIATTALSTLNRFLAATCQAAAIGSWFYVSWRSCQQCPERSQRPILTGTDRRPFCEDTSQAWRRITSFATCRNVHHFTKRFTFALRCSNFPRTRSSRILSVLYKLLTVTFYRAACNAAAVLWWDFCLSVCPSVRPSVCLSVTRVNCDKTVERSVQIFIPYERIFILVFWEEEWLVGGDPFYVKFWVNRPPLERNRRFSTNNRS